MPAAPTGVWAGQVDTASLLYDRGRAVVLRGRTGLLLIEPLRRQWASPTACAQALLGRG